MTARWRLFLAEDSGHDLTEYALIASVSSLATVVKQSLTTITTSFQSAV